MKTCIRFVFLALVMTVSQWSVAYDQKWLPKQPITYTGSCDTDRPQLDKHSVYWNSGKHGSNPEACAYLVDQLIIHREMENYLSRPARCKYDGHTFLPITGSIYFGERGSFANDTALLAGIKAATALIEKGVKCAPSPEQDAEIKRQKAVK